MTETTKTKLSPEAVKMLNEMAAGRAGGVNLTPEAQANLDKLSNFHLTQTYQAHKNSYLVMSLVLLCLGAGSVLFGLDSILRDPPSDPTAVTAIIIMALVPVGFVLGARHFWNLYLKL
ncbi:hypothetical protein [Asticcacaulis excentricus]|uniref:Uncharacterized protein n=1 Tax=Asticcacaulis excentricus (strain ATCC 15261 / DSM 4724 / KCTC 12464 / NCIMB 9791 / VKM B-1370 / CB 48) TaxID=573065 RepID=E8RVY8_ASTEC|nr:hypothetical protein [Asticcacaulis excentricus]ADU15410.1 hypothetical protein Astex_3800 [Asticcacaulis excentricus CB 48]